MAGLLGALSCGSPMKTIILLVLLTAAAALYFGYEPYDLVEAFKPAPAELAKHARVKREPVPEPTPERRDTTIVAAPAPDGSLQSRWPKGLSTPTPPVVKQ